MAAVEDTWRRDHFFKLTQVEEHAYKIKLASYLGSRVNATMGHATNSAHARMHARIPNMHAHRHAHACTRMHAHTHALTNANTHARKHARTHARSDTLSHVHTPHAHMHARTHACTHAHKHACMHSRTHTHTHSAAPSPRVCSLCRGLRYANCNQNKPFAEIGAGVKCYDPAEIQAASADQDYRVSKRSNYRLAGPSGPNF